MCIKRGVNIGIVDKSGRLAEELAAQKGHRELLKWLNEGAPTALVLRPLSARCRGFPEE